ncbi:MAG: iron ABC transporter permease [Anaerolineae bacterium]|jgi:thiamine transport system permease protein|nr:iron ABC transporter permease [Anaerolineae bacterium]
MRVLRGGLYLIPVAFLVLFFVYPLAEIFRVSLTDTDGMLDLSGFNDILTRPYYRETLWFTVWQALVSTALTLALAVPGAYVFVRLRFPGKSLLMALGTLPFVLPTVVVAAAFDALIGTRGLLNQALMGIFNLDGAPIQLERTLALILIAHVFYNVAVALRMIAGYWGNQSPRLEEAARILGVTGWALWWRVRLPMLRPALTAAALLVFIFTFTSFGVVLILGGPRFSTLEVEIYRQTLIIFDLPTAAALSMVQLVTTTAMMVVYTRLQAGVSGPIAAREQVERAPRTGGERLAVVVTVGVMLILVIAPLGALVVRAFTTGGGIENFTRLSTNPRGSILFVPPLVAVWNSLAFAGATTFFAVILGVLTATLLTRPWARWLDAAFMLPLATSAVTLGFGYLVALSSLRSAWLLVPIAHTLVALPFVVRNVLPALRAIPRNLSEAARVLGETPSGIWRRVTLPIVGRAVAVGATFAFTVSMGEFGASLFIARPDTPTMPVVIFRLLGQPGVSNYGQALAMSVILMGVCALGFLVIERLRVAGSGEF